MIFVLKIIYLFIISLILIFIIINFSLYEIRILSIINYFISYIEFNNEIKRNELFYYLCGYNTKIFKFNKVFNPKISIISPIFNRERYILKFISFIQNQNFKNVEIIFVDDSSVDGSAELIEEFKKKEHRIRLIKNKINRGTFLSRNIGVLYSKGDYLVIPDPDDILSKNILRACFKVSEKYNIELIRFNMYTRTGKITLYDIINH